MKNTKRNRIFLVITTMVVFYYLPNVFAAKVPFHSYKIIIENKTSKSVLPSIKKLIGDNTDQLIDKKVIVKRSKARTSFCLMFRADAIDELNLLESDLIDLSTEYINSDIQFGISSCKI